MKKWMRNYRAEFTIGSLDENRKFQPEETITIEYPVTCILDINLGAYQSPCKGVFQFYNLSETVRTKLWLDLYNISKKYIILKFYGGYGNTMPLIFQGNLQECTSQKPSGSVDWITQMWGFEGGFLFEYGYLNQTVAKGTKIEDIIDAILKETPDIKLGYISEDIPPLPRNRTFIGQTMDLLGREYGGYEVFISKGELNILGENDVLPGDIQVITDSSGLLGSPRRANVFVELDTLFEPGLKIDQAIELLSDSMPQFNQLYKVISIKHKGIISAVECGKLITTTTLQLLTQKPKEIKKAVPTNYQGQGTKGKWLKPVIGQITSAFGKRNQPIKGASTTHQGIDIGAGINSAVIAPNNGKVIWAGWQNNNNHNEGYGQYIKIDHGNGLISLYGHLNQILVSVGQYVSTQTQIGLVGSTGNSTGPHLHFGIYNNGVAVNPTQYIGTY